MTKDETEEQSTEEQDSIEEFTEEEATDEAFLDTWMRKSRNDGDLDDDILDLIDDHQDEMSLDEDSLYDALVNHAEKKIENNE
jgi:hypothetical protein